LKRQAGVAAACAGHAETFSGVNQPKPWGVPVHGTEKLTFEYMAPEPGTWLLLVSGVVVRRRVARGRK